MQTNGFTSADFIRLADASKRGKTVDDILCAALDGQINLAVFAGSWFAWEAEHRPQEPSPIRKGVEWGLLGKTFLFVDQRYIERFRDAVEIEMGMFRSRPDAPIDCWCELAKGKKPLVRRDSLRLLKSEADSFLGEAPADAPSRQQSMSQESQWKNIARAEGDRIHKLNPKLSIDAIAKKVHEKLKITGSGGRGGKIPSPGTIKRHALTGIKN